MSNQNSPECLSNLSTLNLEWPTPKVLFLAFLLLLASGLVFLRVLRWPLLLSVLDVAATFALPPRPLLRRLKPLLAVLVWQ